MEFEEHEVTSDHDQDGPDLDSDDTDVEEKKVQPKKKVKPNTDSDTNPQKDKKLMVKDKAAKNFEEGILDKNRMNQLVGWQPSFSLEDEIPVAMQRQRGGNEEGQVKKR